jgi:site-specific recombinase XerD
MFGNLVNELKLRGYSEKSIKNYLYFNEKFIEFIQKSPRDINSDDIKKYLTYLVNKKARPRTTNLAHSALKFYYSDFMNKQLFKRVKRTKIEKDLPRILSKDEIYSMIHNTTNPKHKLLITFLYSSGTRIEETVKIKLNDIDVKQKIIFIKSGKGKKDRYIITSERFLREMNFYLRKRDNDSTYLFDSIRGSHISVRTAEEIIKNAAKKAGINKRVYPHLLRASFTTHLLENEVPVHKIQKILGHSRTSTTLGYNRQKTNDIKEVISPMDC